MAHDVKYAFLLQRLRRGAAGFASAGYLPGYAIFTAAELPAAPWTCPFPLIRAKSYVTIWKAVRGLARRGLVITRRGASTIASGAHVAQSRDRLIGKMRENILNGSWKAGEPAPKFAYFESTYRVSTDTISAAFLALAKEWIVHKLGRRWIIGPARRRAASAVARGQPTVLLAVPYLGNLRGLFEFSFNARFMIPFSEELMRAGIRQHFAQMRTIDSEEIQRRAIRDAEALIRQSGDRYLGAFVHRGPYRFDEYHDNMDRWINFLRTRDKPVVFFDSNGANEIYSRARYGNCPRYFRMHFDEHAGVRCALDALTGAGHRRIGFPVPSEEPSEWITLRAKIAETILRQSCPDSEMLIVALREGIWNVSAHDVYDSMYSKITASRKGKQSGKGFRSSYRALLESTPSFRELLEKQVTAIIAPNDTFALAYYQWFSEAGIEIPRRLSMISFDNAPEAAPFPISTIDFGFGRLGHQAAHVLIGDLPIPVSADGNYAGICTYVDRGSVAPERKAALQRDYLRRGYEPILI